MEIRNIIEKIAKEKEGKGGAEAGKEQKAMEGTDEKISSKERQ